MSRKTISIILISLLIAASIAVFKFLEFGFFSDRLTIEFYAAIIAISFMGLGIYFGLNYSKRKVLVKYVEKSSDDTGQRSARLIEPLSKREEEILKYLVSGYNNQDIADQLYLSINTVKTHINNIYIKLDVKSRTQAVLKAQELKLI